MAQAMVWYRAYHGTVTDPVFGVVAARSKQRRGDAISMWHYLLEEASASSDRGNPGRPDFEAIDLLLGMDEGGAEAIYSAMVAKGLVVEESGRLEAWDRRQPKREREDATAAARKQAQRVRDAAADTESRTEESNDGVTTAGHGESDGVTPRHAMSRHVTPRGEEKREESSEAKASEAGASPVESPKPKDPPPEPDPPAPVPPAPAPPPKSPEDAAKADVWRSAVGILAQGGCADEAQARTFMGKLVKDYTFPVVKDAVAAAVTAQPAEAREYLKATCMRLKGERADEAPPLPQQVDLTAQLDADSKRDTKPTPEEAKQRREALAAMRLANARQALSDATAGVAHAD